MTASATAHDRARSILTTHRATLDVLATALVEKETLDDADLAEIFGPLDKGTGVPQPAPTPVEEPVPSEPELVGAGSTAAVEVPVAVEAPVPSTEPVPAKRRWWKRVGVRAPRPSGT